MTSLRQYQYAVLRVVADIERGEQFNVAVVLFSRPFAFLGIRSSCDVALFDVLGSRTLYEVVCDRLQLLEQIVRGNADGGPVAELNLSERFHYLTAHSSTSIQPSAVHSGITNDPEATLERLFVRLVQRP